MNERRQPPYGPPWTLPREIYLAPHTQDVLTNLVIEFKEPSDQRLKAEVAVPHIVIPLAPLELLHLLQDLSLRSNELWEIAKKDFDTNSS